MGTFYLSELAHQRPSGKGVDSAMGFFNWAAPAFGWLADRWSTDDLREIADWLRPYVGAGGRLLDVGGGTGALARRLHEALGADVTVLDPTPQMLAYVPSEGPVRAVLGSAEDIPFENSSFDAIIVTDAFHHFADQRKAAAEFARVVRPEGGVIVLELDPSGIVMRTIVAIERLLGEPGTFMTPAQMCVFMAAMGILGDCEKLRGPGYRFVGSTAPQESQHLTDQGGQPPTSTPPEIADVPDRLESLR